MSGLYMVLGRVSEGSWETLSGHKTLQEAEEVYQSSDPEKYSIVEIRKGEELIMTSDDSPEDSSDEEGEEDYEDHLSPRSRDLQDFADRPPNPFFHIIG